MKLDGLDSSLRWNDDILPPTQFDGQIESSAGAETPTLARSPPLFGSERRASH